ncbi:hypothetical protein O9Z70_13310 [Devosia sp. YIM 151766]|uniref:hypothetical protein n=1 Tax=Devosia sp. YIM 151766 TaxID=3017325 RepID=UPI00255CDBFB|nr:hypothetical protein [Devosia sp. YIM 151766]WIY52428.1 hypothetical protein O9Z70_13310 [Devosia sp. YIM 151766]
MSSFDRRWLSAIALSGAVLAASNGAIADSDANENEAFGASVAPYERILLEFVSPPPPPGLTGFTSELADIATGRDAQRLEPFLARDFFWERDYGGGFEQAALALDNFKAALSLDATKTSRSFVAKRWNDLDRLLRENTFMAHPERAGVYCTRADPAFIDPVLAETVARATESQYDIDWIYVRNRQDVRNIPDAAAPVIAQLENEAAQIAGWTFLQEEDDSFWYEVALPTGARGYLMDAQVENWLDHRICFDQTEQGWQIAGYQGGGD